MLKFIFIIGFLFSLINKAIGFLTRGRSKKGLHFGPGQNPNHFASGKRRG